MNLADPFHGPQSSHKTKRPLWYGYHLEIVTQNNQLGHFHITTRVSKIRLVAVVNLTVIIGSSCKFLPLLLLDCL